MPTSRATRVTSEVEHAELLDHGIDDRRRAEELALKRSAVDIERDGFEEIALRSRGDGTGHLSGRPDQIVDQGIDRVFHLAPGAVGPAKFYALFGLSFTANDLADALQLPCHALVGGDDFIESIGNLTFDADVVAGQANGKIPAPHGLQGGEQFS